jgi:hypothetical protein
VLIQDITYILNQEEHHRRFDFQTEFRSNPGFRRCGAKSTRPTASIPGYSQPSLREEYVVLLKDRAVPRFVSILTASGAEDAEENRVESDPRGKMRREGRLRYCLLSW